MNDCCICLEELDKDAVKEDIVYLQCFHKMHKECFSSFMKSSAAKKCPLCRNSINIDIDYYTCGICNEKITSKPEDCDTLRSEECGCIFHFKCIKSIREFYCKTCNRTINTENVDALTYLYFANAYDKWIGCEQKCKKEGCYNRGNPKRLGFCCNHNSTMVTNISVILSFGYIIRYVYDLDTNKRSEIFIKLIDYMYKNHPYDDFNVFDYKKAKENIEKINYL